MLLVCFIMLLSRIMVLNFPFLDNWGELISRHSMMGAYYRDTELFIVVFFYSDMLHSSLNSYSDSR